MLPSHASMWTNASMWKIIEPIIISTTELPEWISAHA